MKIHQTTGVERNFGDQLNAWMWRDLYPGLFDGADDGNHFIGIGSILDTRLPRTGINIVLGTGTGYAPAPDMHAEPARWQVYGVRGPLTARLLNLPDKAALTDPAVLLADHARWSRRPGARHGAVFVPHWKSVRYGQWAAACALAGIDFVDPRGDAPAVIDKIAGAKLVVAESMHAAIIADALRVPWIPVVLSREVAPFKWTDWAATLALEYTPLLLAPSSPLEVLRGRMLEHSAFAHIGAFRDQARRGDGPRELAWTREQLLLEHAGAMARIKQRWRIVYSVCAEAALKRAARIAPAAHQRLAPALCTKLRERAAGQLRQVLAAPPQLSSDKAHERGLARCHEAVARLQADCRAGHPAAWHPAAQSRQRAAMPSLPGLVPARSAPAAGAP